MPNCSYCKKDAIDLMTSTHNDILYAFCTDCTGVTAKFEPCTIPPNITPHMPFMMGQKLTISYGKMQLPLFLIEFINNQIPKKVINKEPDNAQKRWREKNKSKLKLYYQEKYKKNKAKKMKEKKENKKAELEEQEEKNV
jgi:hypothetical protein